MSEEEDGKKEEKQDNSDEKKQDNKKIFGYNWKELLMAPIKPPKGEEKDKSEKS